MSLIVNRLGTSELSLGLWTMSVPILSLLSFLSFSDLSLGFGFRSEWALLLLYNSRIGFSWGPNSTGGSGLAGGLAVDLGLALSGGVSV